MVIIYSKYMFNNLKTYIYTFIYVLYILMCSKYEVHMILIRSLYVPSLYTCIMLQYPFEKFEVTSLFHMVVTNFGHIFN
jgi:hypothetical protein